MANIESKLLLAQKIIDQYPLLKKTLLAGKWKSEITYHGIDLCLFTDHTLLTELKILIPLNWFGENEASEKIFFLTPKELSVDFIWDDLSDANCFEYKIDNLKITIQRDFLFIEDIENKTSVVVCHSELEKDGFFNFLRFYLPKKFLNANKILMHSSCVVYNQQAYLFLGHSFAGKSTCAGLCQMQGAKVLADDMNVATFEDGKIWIEGAALGQALQDREFIGLKYELKNVYVLKKSTKNKLNSIALIKQYRHLYSSFANVFSSDIEAEEIGAIMEYSNAFIKKLSVLELEFNLNFSLESIIANNKEEHFIL